MHTQSSGRHRRWSRPHHFVLLPLIFVGFVGACVNLVQSLGDHGRLYSASLIVLIMVVLGLTAVVGRVTALRAQDRAIRAEENLRHFAMAGTLLDPRITMKQVIALRFASDAEFVALAQQVAERELSQAEIKNAIAHWRPDRHRA